MPLPQASADHYRQQQQLAALAVAAARRAWSGMTVDFDASWRTVGAQVALLLTAAQLAAARQGAAYVPAALAEQGIAAEADGAVLPEGFAGIASDGYPLDTLLLGAPITAKEQVEQGVDPVAALLVAGRWLDMVMQTQVADASREATGAGITARRDVGWVRMVNPPCCSRCAILAGRFYRWSSGFQRHPRCDCRHIPSREDVAGDLTTDPQALLRAGQIRGLSKADRDALEQGADLNQIVNSRRGSSGMTTTEGSTLRRGQPVRLTPAGIYRQAGDDRTAALALLQANRYLAT